MWEKRIQPESKQLFGFRVQDLLFCFLWPQVIGLDSDTLRPFDVKARIVSPKSINGNSVWSVALLKQLMLLTFFFFGNITILSEYEWQSESPPFLFLFSRFTKI